MLATHDLDLADGLLDSAMFLRDGRMVDVVDRPDALRSTYRDIMSRGRASSAAGTRG